MKLLAIETSCDETAVSIIEATGDTTQGISVTILGDSLLSQTDIHAEYGGVFPMLAKREHAKNLVPLLMRTLTQASMHTHADLPPIADKEKLKTLLEREPTLYEAVEEHVLPLEPPPIEAIAVTHGPGLEPTLWVGINFAKALSELWGIPLIPVNHMEGHIVGSIMKENAIAPLRFPALALLISGGHTELIHFSNWHQYEKIGETKDDAVGEAFDKVARMLSLPYPGGPQISRLANIARERNLILEERLPRPMIKSPDFNFSFSGLKTAVLYLLRRTPDVSEEMKMKIARGFEDSVTDVLLAKTERALIIHNAKTLIIGGGVSANKEIQSRFVRLISSKFPEVTLYIPTPTLSTDNAVMIGSAGYLKWLENKTSLPESIRAFGNLSLG